ncbi:hypothetical protein VULLAG_LOCUS10599 [Vulpes lagopus]
MYRNPRPPPPHLPPERPDSTPVSALFLRSEKANARRWSSVPAGLKWNRVCDALVSGNMRTFSARGCARLQHGCDRPCVRCRAGLPVVSCRSELDLSEMLKLMWDQNKAIKQRKFK